MSWIQTYSGRQFWPLSPRAADVDIADIAHSLSLQCRFHGHCLHFYSVAQHSVLVSQALPDDLALWGLLHDAAEAYVSDLPRPLKSTAPAFRAAEDRVLHLIAAQFGLVWPMPDAVAHADDVLLATELRELMAPPPEPWQLGVDALPLRIDPLPPREAKQLFLQRFAALTGV
jgi:hypothetical protein